VTSIRGNPADPLSRGYLCPKGVSLADVHADPDRLRAPVRRVGTGADAEWLEIGWDEALDRVADGLAGALNEHGRNAVGVYLGNPNAHSLGSATHGLAMVKMLRTRNRFSASSVDQIPHQLVAWQLYGHQLLLPIPDIDRTSYFLVFGANPMASNGSLMTVPDFPNRLRALKARGGRMVVVDPRRTETAKVADEHFFVRPGSDAVVVLAMVRTLFEEGLTRPAPYVDRVDRVRELVEPFTPEAAERVSGIAADDVRRLARELAAAAGGGAATVRIGVSTTGFGSLAQWGIQCLNILTGHFDQPGGVLFTEPAIDFVARRFVGTGHYDLWRSRVRGIPEYGGELPAAVMREEIETPGEGQIHAMLTIAGNPVLSTPDGKRLGEAFAGLDFMAGGRHLRQRDHPARRRDPAADHRARARPLRHRLPRPRRPEHRAVDAGRAPQARGCQARPRDLPRAGAARAAPTGRPVRPATRLKQRARLALSPRQIVAGLLRTSGVTTLKQLTATPRASTWARCARPCPSGCRPRTTASTSRPTSWSATCRGCRAWLDERLAATSRRPGPDRAAAQAGQQRVVPQHRAGEPGPAAAPAAHASRGPRRARHRRRRPGHGDVPGRGRDGRRAGDRRRDARRGVPPPRLRAPGRRRPARRASKVPGVSINDLTDPDLLDLSGNAALSGVPVTVALA
jgi:hypothetical protein